MVGRRGASCFVGEYLSVCVSITVHLRTARTVRSRLHTLAHSASRRTHGLLHRAPRKAARDMEI